MKHLINAGCSFSYGWGLKKHLGETPFGEIIAGHLNYKYHSTAQPGVGNTYIANCTVNKLKKLINTEKINPSDIVVLVGWTDMGRYDFWDKEKKKVDSIILKIDGRQVSRQISRPYYNEVCTFFTEKMWDPVLSFYQSVNALCYLNDVCKYYGVSIINLANLRLFRVNSTLTDGIVNDYKQVIDKLMQKDSTFLSFVRTDPNKYQCMPGVDSHPNFVAHQEWATIIMEKYSDILGS